MKTLPLALLLCTTACVALGPARLRPGSDMALPPSASPGARALTALRCANSGTAASDSASTSARALCALQPPDSVPQVNTPPAKRP